MRKHPVSRHIQIRIIAVDGGFCEQNVPNTFSFDTIKFTVNLLRKPKKKKKTKHRKMSFHDMRWILGSFFVLKSSSKPRHFLVDTLYTSYCKYNIMRLNYIIIRRNFYIISIVSVSPFTTRGVQN